ncbi:GNAT family N-acetyltransferase [Staphylococcus sp. 11261D007BR]
MTHVEITPAYPELPEAGYLSYLAMEEMTHPITGTNHLDNIYHRLNRLWQSRNNRFSYQYSWLAKVDGHVAGLITALPVTELERVEKHTVWQLIKMRHWHILKQFYHYFKEIKSLLALEEGYQGEYHISLLAIKPEFHRQGLGTQLIKHVEQFARHLGYNQLSLTVKQDNYKAIRAYEKNGFKIVNDINESPYHLHRMLKEI